MSEKYERIGEVGEEGGEGVERERTGGRTWILHTLKTRALASLWRKMHTLTPSTGCTGYTAKGREKMYYLRFYVIDNGYQFLSQHSMHHGDDNGASF